MWKITFSLFSAFFILLCFFFGLSYLSHTAVNSQNTFPQVWSENGSFIYSGSTFSSFSGSENIFTWAIAIQNIKSLHSDDFLTHFYIEYPDFAEASNTNLLLPVEKEIKNFSLENNENAWFNAFFQTTEWNKIGSVIYTIQKQDFSWNIVDKKKTAFFVLQNGEILSAKQLIDTTKSEQVEKFLQIMTNAFKEHFSQKTPLSDEEIHQNLITYLQNPDFSLSQNIATFYLPSLIFSKEKNENIEIMMDISDFDGMILQEPKKVEKILVREPQKPEGDNTKYVALTFDDGPHRTNTPRLLNILKEKQILATFFMLWKNAEAHPEVVKQVHDAGHEIANHSWDHPAFTKISKQAQRDEIQKTQAVIKNIIGEEPKLFRPPYGAYNSEIVKNVNLTFVLWSVDSRDWQYKNVEKNLKQVLSTVHDGDIILFHDIHTTSVDTIARLVDELHKQWYQFLTVSQLYEKYYHAKFLPEQVCFSMKKC